MNDFELADEFLPVYDVSDAVAVVVHADADDAWAALMAADLIELGRRRPLVGALGAIRALPEIVTGLLHGQRVPPVPHRLTLRDTVNLPIPNGGWVLLGERAGRELALGLVGKFWRPVITYAAVTADTFRDFDEAGYAKTVYSLAVRPLGPDRCLLSAVMRTATTDEPARRWFRRYWTLGVGPGAHVLVNSLLDAVRDDIEHRARRSRLRVLRTVDG